MEEVNKNTEIDNTDKKLHISDVIECDCENKERVYTGSDEWYIICVDCGKVY